jgi:hypothetical protein
MHERFLPLGANSVSGGFRCFASQDAPQCQDAVTARQNRPGRDKTSAEMNAVPFAAPPIRVKAGWVTARRRFGRCGDIASRSYFSGHPDPVVAGAP